MRKAISLIFVLLLGYIVFRAWQTQQTGIVQPLYPGMEVSGEIFTTPVAPASNSQSITDTLDSLLPLPDTQKDIQYVYVARVVIQEVFVPASTSTPAPTYTPYPTQTPYPTPTPFSHIGDFGEGRKYAEIWDVWVMRIIIFGIFVFIGLAIVYVFWLDNKNKQLIHIERLAQINAEKELKLKEKQLEIESAREPDKKIIVNSRGNQAQSVQLTTGFVPKEALIKFCQNYRDIEFDEDKWEEIGIDNDNLAIIFAELVNDKLLDQYGWINRIPTIIEVANALSISRDDVLAKK